MTLVCALALIAVAGCGDSGSPSPSSTASDPDPSTSAETANADPGDLQVIEDWSETLSKGDVQGAADYFALPSTAENGLRIEIKTRQDAVEFNASLPCAAEVVSAQSEAGLTTATFRLSDPPGGDCGPGAGGEASTSFRIADGKIVEWKRADVPADGGAGEEPPPGAPV